MWPFGTDEDGAVVAHLAVALVEADHAVHVGRRAHLGEGRHETARARVLRTRRRLGIRGKDVAARGELGQHQQAHPCGRGAARPGHGRRVVAGDVAHVGLVLRHRDPHRPAHLTTSLALTAILGTRAETAQSTS